ncbi:hypothetical protein HKX54_14550 [Sulfitobacter sp. M57]|uniref:hypothetical protein n=1 Tax=unclassified Sulfitobacter TaxID=196795 RepID=UPI0023E2EA77|nr:MULTISPECIES: hypothetical protein [unclassified Sulfitobacter]MDF3415690.1 hypothetical protein [Sulfitobacter sp. KE5]MDF3423170.1 hypothetical protein [Sulfitobacter sp. KE43]MDF3434236.1 hypothetical protein [Sulfitobacter sp. KE42]MDF3459731.1 hypothetical protein [Sulfitobacter sp. S74]MDF3463774.1 hypothetical protein [Sulfitobacter sp. Ks18]
MLKYSRKSALAFASALSLLASTAQAEEHVVLVLDGSYFPSLVYASPGDTIVFQNDSDNSQTVSGPEGSWTSGPMSPDAEYSLQLEETTPLTFSGEGSDGEMAEGEISYASAPGASE